MNQKEKTIKRFKGIKGFKRWKEYSKQKRLITEIIIF